MAARRRALSKRDGSLHPVACTLGCPQERVRARACEATKEASFIFWSLSGALYTLSPVVAKTASVRVVA